MPGLMYPLRPSVKGSSPWFVREDELIDEGQPEARGLLHELQVGDDATPVKLPGIGFQLNGHSLGPTEPPRSVGADNSAWSVTSD